MKSESEKLLKVINKYVGYSEQEIYDSVNEYEEKLTEAIQLLQLSLSALNYIKNQKVIVSDGYDAKDTYTIASMIGKYLKDGTTKSTV